MPIYQTCELCSKPISEKSTFCTSCYVKVKRLRNKIASVKYKGAECFGCKLKCENFDDISIFDFHHLDADEKDFALSSKFDRLSWKKLKIELDKCVLLCSNCHRKKHNNYSLKEKAVFNYDGKVDIWLFGRQPKQHTKRFCQSCNKDLKNNQKTFCSHECSRKIERPSKSELEQKTQTMSWCAIGREYGVSDNAVRKWAKQYSIIPK